MMTRRAPSKRGDRVLALTTGAAAWSVPALLVAILLSLVIAGWPALSQHGLEFITGTVWAPVQGQYGALPALYGTVVSSIIAIVLAVPIAWGVASLLTEWCPAKLGRFIGSLIELLAAVPSIVYGMWGSLVLCPWLQRLFPSVFPAGSGIASAGIVLALMVTPLITAMTRDAMQQVSPLVKESCYGLGGTSWETLRHVIFPSIRRSLAGAIVLGLGRALGETMAVSFVIGNNVFLNLAPTHQGTSIAALISSQFSEADGSQRSALLALGLLLFLITTVVLAFARMLQRGGQRA